MREIDLGNWIKEGHGFTADSYRNKEDENLLLKLFYSDNGQELAEREFERAMSVEALGVPVPKTYELVSADAKTGILFERIANKRSFGRLCSDKPEKLPEYARIFAEQSKLLHSTKCDTDKFPNEKDVARRLVQDANIREEIRGFLFELLERTEDADTCLHGDLQTGNMVMGSSDGEEKTYFIDLGYFAYGNPVFDISALYLSTKGYQHEESNQEILHMTAEQLEDFWKYYSISYIGSDDPQKLKEFEDRVAPYTMIYMLLIIEAAAGFEPAIRLALAHIEELYNKYK